MECSHCDKRFSGGNKSLNRHIRERHPNATDKPAPEVSCDHPGCSYTTRSQACLISHKKKHGDKDQFECQECDEKFKHKKSLNEHIKRTHGPKNALLYCDHEKKKKKKGQNAVEDISDNVELLYDGVERRTSLRRRMNLCNSSFSSRAALTKHVKQVHGSGQNMCGDCLKSFNDNQGLKDHQTRNSCLKKKEAQLEKRDKNRVSRTQHKCTVGKCTRKFRYPQGLLDHITECHDKTLEVCPCGAHFPGGWEDAKPHFEICPHAEFHQESTFGLFEGDADTSRTVEPEVKPCPSCALDTSLKDRRLRDVSGWSRVLKKFKTSAYALVPLPEKEFNGCDRLEISEAEIRDYLDKISAKNCPILRYRTRANAARNEEAGTVTLEDPEDPAICVPTNFNPIELPNGEIACMTW
jgi:hypothetical protein